MATITATGTATCDLCEDQNLGQLCLNEQSTHQLTVANGGTASLSATSGATATVGSGGFLTITPNAASGFVDYQVCSGSTSAASVVFVGEASADPSGDIVLPAASGSNCFHVLLISGSSDNGGGAPGTNMPGWTIQEEEFDVGTWKPHLTQLTQAASPTSSTINVANSMTLWDGAVVKTFCNVASFTSLGSVSGWSGNLDPVSPTGTMPSGAVSIATMAIDGNQTVPNPPPGYINLISDYAANTFGGVNAAHSASTVGGPWPDPDDNTNYVTSTIVLNPTSGVTQTCETCRVGFTAITCGAGLSCPNIPTTTGCAGQQVTVPLGLEAGQTATLTGGAGSVAADGQSWIVTLGAVGSTSTLNFDVCEGGTVDPTNRIINGDFSNGFTGWLTDNLTLQPLGQYPDDNVNNGGRGLGVMTGAYDPVAFAFYNQDPFPGDPANGVPAKNNWLAYNGNPGPDASSIAKQQVCGLNPGDTYNFSFYYNNVIAVDAGFNPGNAVLDVIINGASTGTVEVFDHAELGEGDVWKRYSTTVTVPTSGCIDIEIEDVGLLQTSGHDVAFTCFELRQANATSECVSCSHTITAIDCGGGDPECIPLPDQNWCVGSPINLPLQPVGENFTLLSGTPSGIFLTGSTNLTGTPTTTGLGTISYRTSGGTQTCQLQYTISDCTPTPNSVATHFII